MTYHDKPLPDEIERGSAFGPGFKTTVIPLSSGFEQRNQDWERARCKGDISFGISTKEYYTLWLEHFYARRARVHTWPFKDWSDFEALDQLIGVGDGSNTDFQLLKTYEPTGPNPYIRLITRPVPSTIVIRVAGVLSANWTLQPLGLIRFNPGFDPNVGQEVRADFEFNVPVRYDVDDIGVELEWVQAGSLRGINIIEIREI